MKKSLLIFAAASAVAFAACNGGNNEGKLTPAQADSIANARLDSASAANKAKTDSAINAQANAQAKTADSLRVIDSIIQATKANTPVKTVVVKKTTTSKGGHKGTTTTTTTTETAPPPETIGNGKPKMTGNNDNTQQKDNNTIGNGKPKM